MDENYNYKLKAKIIEEFGSIYNFCETNNISKTKIYSKLRNWKWNSFEIDQISKLLSIPKTEISNYYIKK